ncbi:HAD-IA family hydrolase [Sporosarcina aquimarina]|uniref:HAD family hydrolase n=1 Tax=Sporosarcina aquimarina TaxID=114975 RepID=UPI00203D3408|nr:HAD-IA family hydrolase [Sporosarcina aquimarina]MCM3759001.1 HAD-IA family hydrolase [Sporosarcina aquimarina]
MIKAILFDLDNTLLDRDASVKLFIANQYERLHRLLGDVQKEEYVSRFLALDIHGYVWKDKVYQQLTHEFKIEQITWEDLLQDYEQKFKYTCVPFPGLFQMLEELKRQNLLLGIITNGFGQFQMENIQSLGIIDYFDVIVISEWEGIKKPDPRIFVKALEKLNVSAGESVFVGDHPENDVAAAMAIGMRGVWKKTSHFDSGDCDYVIDNFMELLLFLNPLKG